MLNVHTGYTRNFYKFKTVIKYPQKYKYIKQVIMLYRQVHLQKLNAGKLQTWTLYIIVNKIFLPTKLLQTFENK